jgi:glycosyltransferase involved in cell wall biosynthesis
MLWTKGIGEFVRAAEVVKKKHPHVQFVMAGGHSGGGAKGNPDSAPKWWLQNVNRRGYVKWIGPVPSNEVMALLDKTDVFVLPSYYPEGVPRSLIEAAAKGKAIITTTTPGCREVVEDMVNGFLVAPNDVDGLVDRMVEFIERPELVVSMGKASRTRAKELFDERKVFEKIIRVYAEAGINVGRG